jgi:iron-sulfur cluster assembly protein
MQIEMTAAAEKFIGRLLRFDGGPGYGLRLLVSPGGCSGLSAEFSVEAAPGAGEAVVEVGAVRLFLPAQSRLLLDGATIDFVDTPASTGLVFHQPGIANSCDSKGAAQPAPALSQRY